MIMQSETIVEISKALCEFQHEVPAIKKDCENTHFRFKYASLSAILKVIKEPLHKNGLAITQFPVGMDSLVTKLVHTSGEFFECAYTMKAEKQTPQSEGSRITYQRRYALGAVLGLDIDEDDDGNVASQAKAKTTTKPAAKPLAEKPPATPPATTTQPSSEKMISEPQRKAIFAISKSKGWTEGDVHEFIENTFRKQSTKELTCKEASKVIDWLNAAGAVKKPEGWVE